MKDFIIGICRSGIFLLFSSNGGPAHVLDPHDILLVG